MDEAIAIRRALPPVERSGESLRGPLTQTELESYIMRLQDEIEVGADWVNPPDVDSTFPFAQDLLIMTRAQPGQPGHRAGIKFLSTEGEERARDDYLQEVDGVNSSDRDDDDDSPDDISIEARYRQATSLSRLFGTGNASLQTHRNVLDNVRPAIDHPLVMTLGADGLPTELELTRAHEYLTRLTHQMVYVDMVSEPKGLVGRLLLVANSLQPRTEEQQFERIQEMSQ